MRISTSQMQQQGVFSLLEQQAKLSKLQNQLATGKRMITPADDPAASARALDLEKSIGTLARYSENADRAEHRLQLEEAILDEVSTNLTRLRDLTLQANNATQDAAGRKMIGAEVDQILAHLVELANSSDGNGEHLFGGTRTKTEPFIASGGQVTYHGDQGQRMNQVGPSRHIASTHSGQEVVTGATSPRPGTIKALSSLPTLKAPNGWIRRRMRASSSAITKASPLRSALA